MGSRRDKKISYEGKEYILAKRKRGTPILSIAVKKGKDVILEKELSLRTQTFATGFAAAKGYVMVLGAPIGSANKGLLVGVEESTGKQVYEKPVAQKYPRFMKFNGKYVIIQVDYHNLGAYDISTGKRLWQYGHGFDK